jgi:cell division protein FtsW (lipid II flippase)
MLSYFIKKTELNKIDKTLFFTFLSLFLIGIFTFFSASMSILNKGNLKFYNMLESQGYASGYYFIFNSFFDTLCLNL